MRAWHFLYEGGRTRDGIVCEVGSVLRVEGEIVPCKRGLHGSVKVLDALSYAPGPIACVVDMRGTLVPHGNPVDKWVCSEREVLAMADAAVVLRKFARECALDVAPLWNAPEVVLQYLRTGDKSLRDAAARAAAAGWDAATWSAAAVEGSAVARAAVARAAAEWSAAAAAAAAEWSTAAEWSAVARAAAAARAAVEESTAAAAARAVQEDRLSRYLTEILGVGVWTT